MNQLEQFLEDISFNTKYKFLEEGKDKNELEEVAKKCRLKLPCQDLSIFKGTYAYVDRQNLNGCTLVKAEVEKALDSLVGKAVDFDHFRKRVVGHWVDAKLEGDTLIAYGVFFKGNFYDDYEDVKQLMEKDTLGISFEAWGTKEMKTANTYNLNEIEFAGGALLMKESPAFPGAGVLEMAKERVLEFASVMTKPTTFIHTEGDSKVKETEKGAIQKIDEEAKKITIEDMNKEIMMMEEKMKNMVGEEKKQMMMKIEEMKKKMKMMNSSIIDELPELARYYISDIESIMKALNNCECPSCKSKGMYDIEMIDYKNNKVKTKCVCEAILSVDLTPSIKLEKKGRDIMKVEEVKCAQQNIEKIDKQETKISIDKAKTTLKKLDNSIDSVGKKSLKQAKEINMKDLLEQYEKATVEEQVKLFKEIVEEVARIKVDVETSKTSIETKDKEVATLKESVIAKDAELATLKTELETVKKTATDATTEIAKRDKEIKDAEIAKRKTELGDLAKDMTDEDVMNEDKFKIAKLTKENTDLKVKIEATVKPVDEPAKGAAEKKDEADLDKGSKDKKKDTEIFTAQKRVTEKAFGKE